MITLFSPLSFFPMKKMGETYGDGPSLMRPNANSCLIQASSTLPSAFDRGYGLHFMEVGASGRSLIVMSGFLFGGNRFESSSENTLQCCLNSFGMVSIVRCVRFLSSIRLHSWAKFVRLKKATTFVGSRPVCLRVSFARLKTLCRYLNFMLCSSTEPSSSLPSVQFTRGLNSLRKG